MAENEGKWYLRESVDAWSAGTEVYILEDLGEGLLLVRVQAGDNPLLEVEDNQLVRRRPKIR